MKKPDIKRLKYPLWFQIVFFVLTVIVPLILLMVEGYKSPSTSFKWTFGVLSSLVVIWAFINKFVISRFVEKVKEREVKLIHDYEIDVGNLDKIKWLWFTNEQKLAAFNAISIALYGSLFGVALTAISKGLMAIRGLIAIVAICYVVAYAMKFIVISVLKGKGDIDYEE